MKEYEKLRRDFDLHKLIEEKCGLKKEVTTDGIGTVYEAGFCPFCTGTDFKLYSKDYGNRGYYSWSCDCLEHYIVGLEALQDFRISDYYDVIDFFRAYDKTSWSTARNKVRNLLQEEENKKATKQKFVNLKASLIENPIKEPTFLVERLVYENAINLISGDPKTYKTYVAIDVVVSVITGGKVFDSHLVNKVGNVLFISPEFDTRSRILKLLKGRWVNTDEVIERLILPEADNLEFIRWSKDKEEIINTIKEYKPVLVVLDPLTYIFDGKITENEPVTEFFRDLKKIIKDYNTTILLTHHNNRMNTDKRMNNVSGASAITRFSDSVIYLERFKEDEEQDFFKTDEELDKADKEIKLIKGVYRHGGEGYKYHKIVFTFSDDETHITSERYSNKGEQGVQIKNIPKAESLTMIKESINKAIKDGKLSINFTKDNVLAVIENSTGKADGTFQRYVEEVLSKMSSDGVIRSIRGKGYTTQTEIKE